MNRILHIYPQLNNAGTEMVIMNIYRNIDKSKFQFDFLLQRTGELDSEVRRLGSQLFFIKSGKNYYSEVYSFLVAHPEYKTIHIHMHGEMSQVVKAAYDAGVPNRIVHSHNARPDLPKAVVIYRLIASYEIEKYSTNFIACSDSAAKWLFPRRYRECTVWNNAINLNKFIFSPEIRIRKRKELGLPDNAKVICHVGRFAKQKNHKRIISSTVPLLRKFDNYYLLLIGSGPLLEEIKQKTNCEKHVLFLGNRTDVPELLNAADLFIFPSLYEGLGIVAVEAQANGLFCLASEGVPESANLNNGCFKRISLKAKDDIWQKEITENIVVNDVTRGLRSAKSLNSDYSIEKLIPSVEQYYSNLIGK